MYGTAHILYTVISALVGISLMIGLKFLIKSDRGHMQVVRLFAVLTVILHISTLWVDFFTTGEAVAGPELFIPIHPCNVIMWLLFALCFIKPNSVAFRIISEFAFWGGLVCGFIGILLNENYGSNPDMLNWGVLKGLLSHSTMLIGCTYLAISGIVKIRVRNVISVVIGLCFFVVDGAIINLLYKVFGLPPCNSMYLLEPPFPSMPWLCTPVMGLSGVLLAFALTAIYEQIFIPADERWYSRIRQYINKRKRKEND